MKKVLLTLLGAALACLAANRIYVGLASDEVKIGWVLDSAVEGFNETRTGRCLDALAPQWRDATTGFGRDHLHRGLAALFFSAVDPETNRFLYRVEIGEAERAIRIVREGELAEVVCEADFYRGVGQEEEHVWRVRFVADFERTPEGWKAIESRYETLEGDGPFWRR